MSMARPYECCENAVPPVMARQLNADVLSAAIDLSSLPPKSSTSLMDRMGYRCSNSALNAAITGVAAVDATTMSPRCTTPSKPMYRILRSVRPDSGTGQPECQLVRIRAARAALMGALLAQYGGNAAEVA